jgi:hypothetical protein
MRVPTGRLTSYTVTIGKVPSLNAFYASKHWTVRAKAKAKHCGEVLQQLQQLDKYELQHVSITCRVHYRYDLDNSVMAIKFALDAFKQWGGVKDDSPKYVDRIKMTYDPSLPKDTAEIIFEGYVVDSDFFLIIFVVSNLNTNQMTLSLSQETYTQAVMAQQAQIQALQPSNGIGGKG